MHEILWIHNIYKWNDVENEMLKNIIRTRWKIKQERSGKWNMNGVENRTKIKKWKMEHEWSGK